MTKENKGLKKLTANELKNQAKKLDAKQEFLVVIGDEEYKLTHDMVFRKTKMHKLLDDMLQFFNSVNGDNIDVLEMASPYTALLILKHFTSLEVSDDIDEALALLNVLIDLEALGTIINALPEQEVTKVYEILTQTVENIQKNIEEVELEALSAQLDNADVLGIEDNGEQDSAEQEEQE